jgi:putative NADH-flavin reductase
MVCLIRELALHGPGLKSKYSNKMDINNHESLVAALKQVDVVISTIGTAQLPDQLNLITAIKEVGHITVCQSLVHNSKHLLNFVTHIAQVRKKIQGLKCRTWGVSLTLRVSGHSEEYHGWVDYPTQ